MEEKIEAQEVLVPNTDCYSGLVVLNIVSINDSQSKIVSDIYTHTDGKEFELSMTYEDTDLSNLISRSLNYLTNERPLKKEECLISMGESIVNGITEQTISLRLKKILDKLDGMVSSMDNIDKLVTLTEEQKSQLESNKKAIATIKDIIINGED